MGREKGFNNFIDFLGSFDSKSLLENNFQKFTSVVLRRLYCNSLQCGLNCIDENLFDLDGVIEYLKIVDEECLDDPEFSKVIMHEKDYISKPIGEATESFMKRRNYNYARGNVTLTISYIPSISLDKPNTIRLDICEDINKSKSFVNGYIDFLSNGRMIVGDFDQMIYTETFDKNGNKKVTSREFNSNIDASSIDKESLDEFREQMSYIFEQSNLKTVPKQKIKR